MEEIYESLDRRIRYLENIVKQLSEICKQLSKRLDSCEDSGFQQDVIK